MDVKITTTIVDVRKENDLYRIELMQKTPKSTVEVNVSLLVNNHTMDQLASIFPPYNIRSLSGKVIECLIEDDKHFSIIFPIQGTFTIFPDTLDYPIETALRKLTLNRCHNISSFSVFNDQQIRSDRGDYFCETYFLATESLNAFRVASGAKDYISLDNAKLTVKADGLCYYETHLWAEKIDINVNLTSFK